MPDSLKPGNKVRVSWPGYWAHGKIVEVARGSRKWGVPIIHPDIPWPVVVGPEKLTAVGRA